MRRIDEIFQKESDPFTTNEGMLEVINTIRFRHFDKAVEVWHSWYYFIQVFALRRPETDDVFIDLWRGGFVKCLVNTCIVLTLS